MSRLAAFIDKNRMEDSDVSDIVADDAIDIRLMRRVENPETDGFEERVGYNEPTHIANVRGRIDRKTQVYLEKNGEVSRSTINVYIATIFYKDIRPGDILICRVGKYQVETISKTTNTYVEVDLEVVT